MRRAAVPALTQLHSGKQPGVFRLFIDSVAAVTAVGFVASFSILVSTFYRLGISPVGLISTEDVVVGGIDNITRSIYSIRSVVPTFAMFIAIFSAWKIIRRYFDDDIEWHQPRFWGYAAIFSLSAGYVFIFLRGIWNSTNFTYYAIVNAINVPDSSLLNLLLSVTAILFARWHHGDRLLGRPPEGNWRKYLIDSLYFFLKAMTAYLCIHVLYTALILPPRSNGNFAIANKELCIGAEPAVLWSGSNNTIAKCPDGKMYIFKSQENLLLVEQVSSDPRAIRRPQGARRDSPLRSTRPTDARPKPEVTKR